MIITKMALPRRTVLRGMGVTLALPLLDAMVPALSATARTAANPVRRFGFFYMPNGVSMNHTGVDFWKPKATGADFEFSPTLKPLEPFRNHVSVVSGLHHATAEDLGNGNGDHTRGTSTWLTGVHPKKAEGSDVRAGVSVDQVMAAHLGKDTALPSLEMGILQNSITGTCDAGYSCLYANTLAWSSPTTPLPLLTNPRLAFERLFGDGGSAEQQRAQLRKRRSILDSVTEDMARLQGRLDASDRHIVSDYLETLREVERRIERTEASNAESPLPEYERPTAVPARFDDHVKLLFDLQLLAFQGDLTRVNTFMFGREISARMYPEIGLSEQHHAMSHHRDDPEAMLKYHKLCTWEVELFAYLADRMRATPDGDGSLLDHSLLLLGSGLSNGHIHSHMDLPTVLIGGAGQVKGNRHIAAKMGTPMCNLLLAMLDKAGVPADSFGDSTTAFTL